MKTETLAKKDIPQREKNPIADMIIWSQTIEKENKHIKLYENFHVTPGSIYAVADKIGVDPKKYFIQNPKNKTNNILDTSVKDYLNRCFDVPRNKYPYPQSES